MDLANIIALIVLTVGLIGHIVTTVWWASRITVILEGTQKSLSDFSVEVKSMANIYVKREDFIRELTLHDKQISTMWDKLDKLKEKVDTNSHKGETNGNH